ncbi:MAG TPA: hypothetical protein VF739_14835 [Ktedonobacterales bacterium]
MSPLSAWDNFYVIVGSSAGALTGLTFIAITLIPDERRRGANLSVPAFTTPTVVHFAMALLISAALSAPWPSLAPLSALLVVVGLGMLAYGGIVVRRLRRVEEYDLVLEDWLVYGACPLVVYLGLVVAGALLANHPTPALFGVAAVLLALLAMALHNAWDLVTFIALLRTSSDDSEQQG